MGILVQGVTNGNHIWLICLVTSFKRIRVWESVFKKGLEKNQFLLIHPWYYEYPHVNLCLIFHVASATCIAWFDLPKDRHILFCCKPGYSLLDCFERPPYPFIAFQLTQVRASISLFILNERVSSQVKQWAMQQMCTKHPSDNGQSSHWDFWVENNCTFFCLEPRVQNHIYVCKPLPSQHVFLAVFGCLLKAQPDIWLQK